MNSAQMTLDLVDDGGCAVHGTVAPMVGQIIHRCDLEEWGLTGCRLNWRPDNTAKVTRQEPDTTGFVRCSAAGGCQVADICAFGKPHAPLDHGDEADRCYDHKPHVSGGLMVWAVPVQANAKAETYERSEV